MIANFNIPICSKLYVRFCVSVSVKCKSLRYLSLKNFSTYRVNMSASIPYPKFSKDLTVIDNYHGTKVHDVYRWLENPESEETKSFVEQQNQLTNAYINGSNYKCRLETRLTELFDYPKVSPPSKHGDKYYQFRNSGLQNQSVLYVMDMYDSEGKVFLDPNEMSAEGTVTITTVEFSKDGKTLAYGINRCGSDWSEIHFINTETGAKYDEVLEKIKYSGVTWCHDNKSVFYAAYLDQEGKSDGSETNANKNQKLYFHHLGTPQSADECVLHFDDPLVRFSTDISDCGQYLILSPLKACKNNKLYFSKLIVEDGKVELNLIPVVTEFSNDYEFVASNGTEFIFRTNKDAPNYRLIIIDYNNPQERHWRTLVPEHSEHVLSWVKPIYNDKLFVCYIVDVKNTLALFKMETGEKITDFPIGVASVDGITGEREHSELFFRLTSFLIPNTLYRIDFTTPHLLAKPFKEIKLDNIDFSSFDTSQVFYESKDGTKIPMFIVHKKGISLDCNNPCLLYGYGGFNISVVPSFSVYKLIFMNNFNGVYAVANIRGGGEYGENWHNAGRFENKQNVFDDFQCAAKYLVKTGYTKPDKLTIIGGSNGGLLVGACINQTPELFGAAICVVGVLDMLRYQNFTIGYAWKSDYGSSDDEKMFHHLYKYSPLHNIRRPQNSGQYPATLLLTGDHDDRVVPIHSYKFIAQLQDTIGFLPQQTQPLLIRVDTNSGHGHGKPTSKTIEEQTIIMSFIQRALGLTYYED